MTVFQIVQNGNHVELATSKGVVTYDVDGVDLPKLTDLSFAVWHLLPRAMLRRGGYDIHIAGPVDPLVIANAVRFSRTFEMWVPSKFREVQITADAVPAPAPRQPGELVCYSGGVDSTHMLLRLGRRETETTALTVHGMDYRTANIDGFNRLIARNAPLLARQNYRQITLRSNAGLIAKGYHGWGLALAGHIFLLSGLFGSARFAADCTQEMDLASHPWGMNHVTNRYLRGSRMVMESLCDDVSRCEKVVEIAKDDLALRTISFCGVREARPDNCGLCVKCLRTKAIFAGMLGEIPQIYRAEGLTEAMMDTVDWTVMPEWPVFIDLYQNVRAAGGLDRVPGIRRWVDKIRATNAAEAARHIEAGRPVPTVAPQAELVKD
ncbi:hypothetical protein [Methylobrevis albus]|uniref:Uncharacterized protein n=1 Tax=Methylobrevis albus TaxID=2793297 RepID=A0A931MY64_9HYPH|nr:hypothetical protein [Methylobrevis albus]MBH0237670.1 hypothetical protein [Methylobrevis albus]